MHAYLIILEITPLKVGGQYDMLPLHCTLVHWFWLNENADVLTKRLLERFSSSSPITLTAQDERTFTGKTKQGKTVPVSVNSIALTPELQELHERACRALEAMGVRYAEPGYIHKDFIRTPPTKRTASLRLVKGV